MISYNMNSFNLVSQSLFFLIFLIFLNYINFCFNFFSPIHPLQGFFSQVSRTLGLTIQWHYMKPLLLCLELGLLCLPGMSSLIWMCLFIQCDFIDAFRFKLWDMQGEDLLSTDKKVIQVNLVENLDAQAMLFGLQLAKDACFHWVKVESDSLLVINGLNHYSSNFSPLAIIFEDILHLSNF